MPTHKYIKFTGEYNKLKKMGFTFQKLYASNYMQWCDDDTGIRVWKGGKDMTIDSFTNHSGELLDYLINNRLQITTFPATPLFGPESKHVQLYFNSNTGRMTQDNSGYMIQYKANMMQARKVVEGVVDEEDAVYDRTWREWCEDINLFYMIKGFYEMGWIELAER